VLATSITPLFSFASPKKFRKFAVAKTSQILSKMHSFAVILLLTNVGYAANILIMSALTAG
jgi:hypothetical protein